MTTGRDSATGHISRDLEVMASADNYYGWILAELSPLMGRRVLECGAGRGTLTTRLLGLGLDRVVASDVEPVFLDQLRAICRDDPSAEVVALDLEQPSAAALNHLRAVGVDSIVMVNVLEHLADDERSLSSLAGALGPGGRILIFAPAFQALFSDLDRWYGHYRRYRKADLVRLAGRLNLRIVALHYANVPGFVAWLVLHRWLRRPALDAGAVSLFNRVAPVVRRLESRRRPPFGLSIVAVLERT